MRDGGRVDPIKGYSGSVVEQVVVVVVDIFARA